MEQIKRYITVDGGTTNTRLSLVEDGKVVKTVARAVGSNNKDNRVLKQTVKEALGALLAPCELTEKDITAVIASGMITSEYGLHPLPHLPLPAGVKELHASMETVSLPDVTTLPITFIRGAKSVGDSPLATDMMRGEETELMGLPFYENAVYVLPGTHSKIVETDGEGRVTRFATHMTGEMAAALSSHTILKEAVSLETVETDRDALFAGYKAAVEQGISAALFKVRVGKNLFSYDEKQTYGFFLGAILASEVQAILRTGASTVVIAGKRVLREALRLLLNATGDARVICVEDEAAAHAPALGAVRIFEGA